MIKPGKCIVIESVSGFENLKYLNSIEKILSKDNSVTKIFSSIEQYDDVLINLLSRIESSTNVEIDLISNLYLYVAAFTRVIKRINEHIEAGINCIVSNTYLKLLSEIYAYYYGIDEYSLLYKIITDGIRNFNYDLLIILDDGLSEKDFKKKVFFQNLLAKNELLVIDVAKPFRKNIDIAEDKIKVSRKRRVIANNQIENKFNLDLNYEKNVVGYRISVDSVHQKIVDQLSSNTNSRLQENQSDIYYFNQISALAVFYFSLYRTEIKFELTHSTIGHINFDIESSFLILKKSSDDFKSKYIKCLTSIFELYSKLTNKFTKQNEIEVLSKMLPLSLKKTLIVRIDRVDTEQLLNRLSGVSLEETSQILNTLDRTSNKLTGSKRFSEPNQLLNLSDNLFGKKYDSFETLDTKLIEYYPKNELNIINGYLYKYSGLDFDKTSDIISSLDFEQKSNILKNYIKTSSTDNVLNDSFFIFESYLSVYSLNSLIRQFDLSSVVIQSLSSRYGYHLPDFISEEKDIEVYQNAFDMSLVLQKLIVENCSDDSIQYGYLHGNLVRAKLKFSYSQLIRILDSNDLSYDSEIEDFKNQIRILLQDIIFTR